MQGKFKKPVAKKPYASKTRKPRSTAEVAKLKAAVAKLSKISYDKVPMYMASCSSVNSSLGQAAGFGPNVFPLLNGFSAMTPVWGYTGADINECTKGYLNDMAVKITINQSNEPDLIRHSIFVVSLKDQGADSTTFDPATGGMPALTDGIHFSYGASNNATDQAMVSPRFFNIHKVWRTFTGGIVGGQTVQPAIRQMSCTIRPKQKLYQNPRGNLFNNASFSFSKDPSQNYYVLVFTDNLTTDFNESPKMTLTTLQNWSIPS